MIICGLGCWAESAVYCVSSSGCPVCVYNCLCISARPSGVRGVSGGAAALIISRTARRKRSALGHERSTCVLPPFTGRSVVTSPWDAHLLPQCRAYERRVTNLQSRVNRTVEPGGEKLILRLFQMTLTVAGGEEKLL